jgi:hypothetical protein
MILKYNFKDNVIDAVYLFCIIIFKYTHDLFCLFVYYRIALKIKCQEPLTALT